MAMVMPAEGPSLGVAPSGTWMWMSKSLVRSLATFSSKILARTIAEGRPGRLLHHLAQLSGQDEVALAVDLGGFEGQQFAAEFGPGHADGHADLVLPVHGRPAEFRHARDRTRGSSTVTRSRWSRPWRTTRLTTLRQTDVSSRSRFRTPASRV